MAGNTRERKPLKWDETKRDVLRLIFEGRLSQAKIAQNCGIPLRTCEDWIAHPDFQTKLAEMRAALVASLADMGVAYIRKEQRLIGLAQMAESARAEYEARPWLKEVRPTPDGELVNEHFNRDAHAAFRESLADIAAELGARKNVVELDGALEVTERVTFYLPQPEQPPTEATETESDDAASS